MAVQRKIFISYRRADNPDFADRIRDWFIQRYGRENVFMDFDSIPPGVKFADHIRWAIEQSDAVIVIIGPRWVDLFQERIAKNEADYVRIELGLALELEKPMTPICISGTPVPAPGSLPPELRPLLDYNIAFLDRTNFYERIKRIIAAVEAELAAKSPAIAMGISAQPQLSAEDYFNKAIALNDNSKLEISYYTEAIRLNPQFVNAYNNRGTARYSNGDLSGAIADYTEVIRLNPQGADSYFNRGTARQANADLSGAIADYTEAIRLNPQGADAYSNRGLAHSATGDFAGAIADYTEAIRLNPQGADAYNNRGLAHSATGNFAGAIADYTEAIRLNPQHIYAYNNRAALRKANGDLSGAIADYTEAIHINPQHPHAYNNRAALRKAGGDLAGAVADYSEAIRTNPSEVSLYIQRGLVHQAMRNWRGAHEDFWQASLLERSNPMPHFYDATVYETTNSLELAIASYQRYLHLGGGGANGNRAEIEEKIRYLQAKMTYRY